MASGESFLSWAPMQRLVAALEPCGLFDQGAVVLARAPGRLDVMGGIADYTGALVCELPLAVAAGAAVQRRGDGLVVCRSMQIGRTVEVVVEHLESNDPLEVRQRLGGEDRWALYAVGCVWWLLHAGSLAPGHFEGATILLDSDVPLGGGVSSSAAVEVATMSGLCGMVGARIEPLRLAAACQAVENKVVGAPCGVMDQVTSVMGETDALLEILCQADSEGLPAQVLGTLAVPRGYRFVGLYSGASHEVSGDPYTDTRVAAFMGQRILNDELNVHMPGGHLANVEQQEYLASLRGSLPQVMKGAAFMEKFGTTRDAVTSVRPEKEYHVRAATDHHVLEMARVKRFVALLKGEQHEREPDADPGALDTAVRMEEAGRLMYESHASYGQCARLGHPLTDQLVAMVEALGPESGFCGAKITGGGGGGTVAILLRDQPEALERLAHLRETYETRTGRGTILFDASGPGAAALGTRSVQVQDVKDLA